MGRGDNQGLLTLVAEDIECHSVTMISAAGKPPKQSCRSILKGLKLQVFNGLQGLRTAIPAIWVKLMPMASLSRREAGNLIRLRITFNRCQPKEVAFYAASGKVLEQNAGW
jgi:hypothetical protein